MILGFLGKGGSGKSSVSTQMALWLKERGSEVLAIDADHNMDLSYNLTKGDIPEAMRYLGTSLDELQACVNLAPNEKYSEAFLRGSDTRFSFGKDSIDSFTEKYSYPISGIRLMTAGPQTDQVLFGQSCSHVLTTPLKIYLPLLKVSENEEVIVDEKAGADGVTTGIVTGIDVAVIICEPALHSIKTAKQISELLEFYETPYVVVANKVISPSDKEFVDINLGKAVIAYFGHTDQIRREPGILAKDWSEDMEKVYKEASTLNRHDRIERTTKKFVRNTEYSEAH
jgi:CO dehydrogenase maturation factor